MTGEPMRLRCACGWETSGTEEEVVAAATEHGGEPLAVYLRGARTT